MIYNERRDFLRLMYNTSVVTALSPMLVPQELYASSSDDFSDYKALVYVSLEGGNDAFNMVVPTDLDGGAGYNNYKAIRTNIAVSHSDLSSALRLDGNGRLDLTTSNPYATGSALSNQDAYLKGLYHINGTGVGINAVMPELAQLAIDNKVAILANTGTLVEPSTKDAIKSKLVELPIFLYAHNHQRRVQETGQANNKSTSGWIGKLFDNWANVNGSSPIGKNISFAGNNHSLVGDNTAPLNMSVNPKGYNLNSAGLDMRKKMYELSTAKPFEDLYNRMIGRSFTLSDTIIDIWNNARTYTTTDAYGDSLFSVPSNTTLNFNAPPNSSFIKQLEAVAKMIDYGKDNGLKRQVFFVKLTGFDTHGSQLTNHPKQLRALSMGLDKFQRAMEEIGISDKVTTFTLTDFGRTVANNGDGTDHAWGGHNIVVGGAVNGGLYGEMPDLTLGGDQDTGRNGRIIPTISIDQQLSTITKWFGVNDALVETLFPNIVNFDNTTFGRDIGFMG